MSRPARASREVEDWVSHQLYTNPLVPIYLSTKHNHARLLLPSVADRKMLTILKCYEQFTTCFKQVTRNSTGYFKFGSHLFGAMDKQEFIALFVSTNKISPFHEFTESYDDAETTFRLLGTDYASRLRKVSDHSLRL